VQSLERSPIARPPLALGNHRLFPIKTEPVQVLDHRVDEVQTETHGIQIVVAQQQRPTGDARSLGRQPEGARMAEMQKARGRRREAAAVRRGRHVKEVGRDDSRGPSFEFELGSLNSQLSLSGMSKLLCVYCASSDRLDPKYYAAAAQLGRELVLQGWGLVYGGGNTGMMGAVARAVKQSGGRVVGVIPEFMKARELAYTEADELVTVITMRERKLLMETRADAFVALPGGWGTLEEIVEILTLRQLDVVKKPCVFLNQDGFYDPLLQLFERMLAEKFFRPSNMELFRVATTVSQIFEQIASASNAKTESKWFETR
jgi:cytokinin riboside 5'-monophosphate phosphoribohydrolase